MTRNNVLVLGGNFDGLTDALAVQHELDGDVDVRVVSASDRFLFNPSLILADKLLPPRKNGLLIPGPQSHLMKLAFEKYFLWKARHGYVNLP
jgi:sulfide:quinone oxidoreductase